MGKYSIAITDQARRHLLIWQKSGNANAIHKIERIFRELSNTPYTGIGKPEKLKYGLSELWSRRIDKKNRIIYMVNEEIVTVFVLTAKGHYSL